MKKPKEAQKEEAVEFFEFGQHDQESWVAGYKAALAGALFKDRPRWAAAASPALRRKALSWEAGWVVGSQRRAQLGGPIAMARSHPRVNGHGRS